jgi:hypothetical protein
VQQSPNRWTSWRPKIQQPASAVPAVAGHRRQPRRGGREVRADVGRQAQQPPPPSGTSTRPELAINRPCRRIALTASPHLRGYVQQRGGQASGAIASPKAPADTPTSRPISNGITAAPSADAAAWNPIMRSATAADVRSAVVKPAADTSSSRQPEQQQRVCGCAKGGCDRQRRGDQHATDGRAHPCHDPIRSAMSQARSARRTSPPSNQTPSQPRSPC